MSVSSNVVIMTTEEFEAVKLREFHRGCERGRFEQRCDDAKAYKNTPERSGTAREAPSTNRDGTTVGAQPAAQLSNSPIT